MNSLVQQFSAAGQILTAAPLLYISRPSSMAVYRADEVEWAESALHAELMGTADCRMEAQSEPNLEYAARVAPGSGHVGSLVRVPAHRLLTQNMLSRTERRN